MLSANILQAYCLELMLSEDMQRELLLDKLNHARPDETPIERDARQLSISLCRTVFAAYPVQPMPQKRKRGAQK